VSGTFSGQSVLVVGAGVAGRSAAAALADEGATVRIVDLRGREALGDLASLDERGIALRTGEPRPDDVDGATLVLASPGVSPSAEIFALAAARSVPVWGEMELGARLARVPYLAVTGTNGKTTATGMLTSCLRAAGIEAVACGNIGFPFPEAARSSAEVLVVEVSSFQLALQDSFRPRISVLLNVAPDHLDWHGTFEAYQAAKARIFARQEGSDAHVGNAGDPLGARISRAATCRTVWFRGTDPGAGEVGYVDGALVARLDGEVSIGSVGDERPGFREDAAAVAAAALAFGLPADAVMRGLLSYQPPPHRGEVVADLDGVRFIDDSKATNVHAALAAIDATPGAVLIAGGRSKGQDLAPLGSRAERLTAVVAIGESRSQVVRAFGGRLPVRRAASIEQATRIAYRLAPGGGTVLLAPACASWDAFRDYAERGDRFAAAARGLASEGIR
jgi:UDP-N-acetylmuramoylalanine--D-glutamate ligase